MTSQSGSIKNDFFVKIEDMVPVYHIHGICNNPNDIVITNEDYAYLFRPNDYRQARLPFLKIHMIIMLHMKKSEKIFK